MRDEIAKALKRSAAAAARNTIQRDQLIAAAYQDGASMREIARAVGMTHPGVRNILIRDGIYDATRSEPPSDDG